MADWTKAELERIGASIHLEIQIARENGTLRKPTTIWVVCVGDDLFVRSYLGRESTWFRHAQQQHRGCISAGGIAKDVTFVDVSDDQTLTRVIDAAYRSKYQRYSPTYLEPMITPKARAATLKLVPWK